MRFAGIDVGAERHMVAVVDEESQVLCRSSPFGEDSSGYTRLFELLGPAEGCLVALEATGHYWRNLFIALLANGYAVAVLNPLRTRRFAEEELQRTKTDAIDALGIARFAAEKRPRASQLPDPATEELRELARLRERLAEDFASRLRQLHRAVDLAFPSSPDMCVRSRASSPQRFCRGIQLRHRSRAYPRKSLHGSSTTARTRSARNWRAL